MFAELWDFGDLIKAGGYHNILGFIGAFTGSNEVSISSLLDAPDFDATVSRQIKALHIVVEILDDVGQGHESVWVVSLVFCAGHSNLKVWRNQGERIPALIPPRICDSWGSFEDDVFAAFLLISLICGNLMSTNRCRRNRNTNWR